ncbi:MAG: N-acetyl-gamma-glutamyl-phosphate reductase [Pseudomonadota bacterium]|nr:N-acetyl-gamma-glutamyl-phosphate reductase [Pseudomonadota bacterium]
MIQVGIVGGTGYTGVELLRLLVSHPEVRVAAITSRGEAGTRVDQRYPNLRGHLDLIFTEPDLGRLSELDVVFFATPHGVAMQMAPALLEQGVRVIDLSADFRLQDPDTFQDWYAMEHVAPDLLKQAVYGLVELNRAALQGASLVAVPGCYPTAVQLGFAPLLEVGCVEFDGLIADTKSGVSGAGRQAKVQNLLCEASENMKAYGVAGHRHLPEIRAQLQRHLGAEVGLTFVPHLTPMIRGIHATLYARLTQPEADLDIQDLFERRYASDRFVDVLPAGAAPETRSVRGANDCRLAVHRPQGGRTLVVLSVIDNLVKGAAGQAVQCMNLCCGFDEGAGLSAPALLP